MQSVTTPVLGIPMTLYSVSRASLSLHTVCTFSASVTEHHLHKFCHEPHAIFLFCCLKTEKCDSLSPTEQPAGRQGDPPPQRVLGPGPPHELCSRPQVAWMQPTASWLISPKHTIHQSPSSATAGCRGTYHTPTPLIQGTPPSPTQGLTQVGWVGVLGPLGGT